MKILQLSWNYPPEKTGGIAEHMRGLSEALAEEGHKVKVVTAGTKNRESSNPEILNLEISDSKDDIEWSMKFGERAREEADFAEEADIIHAHDWMTVPAAVKLSEAFSKPLVFTLHSIQKHRSGISSDYEESINKLEWYGTYKADRIICVGEDLKEKSEKQFDIPSRKTVHIPNGIDASRFGQSTIEKAEYARNNERIILYAGRMVEEKGPIHLIRAMKQISSDYNNIKLVMCGGGNVERYRSAAHQALGNKAYVTGFVPQKTLEGLMTEAYVNVTPSIKEPFGLVPLEAAASNTATVGSKVGGIKHTVVHEKTGLHSMPGSPESIASQLRRSLDDPRWNQWMSENAAERARKKFNWDKIAERTSQVYRNAINKN